MHHYQLAIPQLMPNGMRVFLGLIVIADEASVELSVDDILALYYPQKNSKDRGQNLMYPRKKRQVVGEMKNTDRYWQDWYFFMLVNEKSLNALANAFYPLWGLLRKELRKPPPKALLFGKKLEQLLAEPNREWDEINVPNRLRLSSLCKNFVEIQSGIIKRIPSWVDWPFVIRGALRRLFDTPLFIEPLSDEETLIAELALDTMKIDFPSPKKRVDEKPKKKVPTRKKDTAKAIFPESNIEPQLAKKEEINGEVNLPPRMSLLQDEKLGVHIMRQLLTDVDMDTVNEGRVQSHLDDFSLDGLKCILRGMGLIYHSIDKDVERRE
ncbi:hypothetical protein TIFTF001_020501 [Ficus carica]|uniref:Uncharacterized protein n=1 Tax=Ficus carica TaxID=3494 RepID=A0AA88AFV4_FICCA|nr:hypothetical protein TIFTF001_020501 [Ficus carica]